MVLNRLRAFLSAEEAPVRETGPPTSSNGASSHHLFWVVPEQSSDPTIAVTADLEILEPPSVDRLYFWALQATFRSGGARMGGAHLGLQWHPDYPGSTAANWGGYHGADSPSEGELSGSALSFPSALHNPNTCNYPWKPSTPYRLGIALSEPGIWTGSVGAVDEGSSTTLRTLHCDADHLTDFVVWTEAFADCDAPPAVVRWSRPRLTSRSGRVFEPTEASVNYQSVRDGGCSTSDSLRDRTGLVQATGAARTTPQGAHLEF